jgi:hypothetical protein
MRHASKLSLFQRVQQFFEIGLGKQVGHSLLASGSVLCSEDVNHQWNEYLILAGMNKKPGELLKNSIPQNRIAFFRFPVSRPARAMLKKFEVPLPLHARTITHVVGKEPKCPLLINPLLFQPRDLHKMRKLARRMWHC